MRREHLALVSALAVALVTWGCDSGGGDGGSGGEGGADTVAGEDSMPGEDSMGGEDTPPVTGDFYGSCDQGNQCSTYPSTYTEAERKVVFDICPGSGGTWLAGQPCPGGWDAACEDYTAGSVPGSTYYYEGHLGLTQAQCEDFGGTFSSTLPDFAGSCWPSDGECQDFLAAWDTPSSVAAACGDGTYSPDPCTMDDIMGICTADGIFRTFYYYAAYPDIHFAETLCGNIGGVWSLP